jgi:WD40 repeat protein/predicted Ser/Thr protein kinase
VSAGSQADDDALPLDVARRVDRVCTAFEAAWRAGRRPRVEDCLAGEPGAVARALLPELLLVELEYRRRAGEQPQVEEYRRRFPGLDLDWPAGALTPADPRAPPRGPAAETGPGGADLGPGRCIGDYELLGELGRGGMGVVYKARQKSLNRTVALKLIRAGGHPEARAGPQVMARFRAEALALARLQHPNVVQVYEVGEQDGRPFFAMEYVDGGSLADRLAGTPPPPGQAATLVQTLARAMHRAHEQGIIHRDLKPANVLLTADRIPKVTDFGLAKVLMGTVAVRTQKGAVLGTPGYMAPEQAGGKSREVSPATDVYALGAILYELLTGRPPFQAKAPADLLEQVLQAEPVPPSRLRPEVPRDLEAICLKCLHKQAGKRYATAAALADDLGRFLAGEPVQARPVGRGGRLVKWAKRRPAAVALVALGAAMVCGLAGGGWWHASREAALRKAADTNAALYQQQRDKADRNAAAAQRERDRARLNEYVAHINLAQREWEDGHLGRVLDLLEAHLPREGEEDVRGFEWHYLWSLCHGELLALPGHTGTVLGVAWGPDGRYLASASMDGTVRVWGAASGKEVRVLTGHTREVRMVVFSRDGQRLASVAGGGAREPGEVKVWDAADGHEVCAVQGRFGYVRAMVFSPDGRRLVTAGADPDQADKPSDVNLWDAATGRLVRALPVVTAGSDLVALSPDGQRLAWRLGRTVNVCDTDTGKPLCSVRTHAGQVVALAFSPDNQRLATGGLDGSVEVWDMAAARGGKPDPPPLTLRGHMALVTYLAFSPDGTRLASADLNGVVKVWGAITGRVLLTLKAHESTNCLAFSPDGQRLVTVGRDTTLKVWDATAGPAGDLAPPQVTLLAGTGRCRNVAFSPDGQRLATAADAARVWEAATGQQLLCLEGSGRPGWESCVAFSPDGRTLAAPSPPDLVLWDGATGREVLRIKARLAGKVVALAFSPDGQRLASGGVDESVRVWDVSGGKAEVTEPFLALHGPTDSPVWSVAFSPDGRRLATGGMDETVRVWDVPAGGGTAAAALVSREIGFPVECVAFSPDGRRLASASEGGGVCVWDVSAGRGETAAPLLGFRGHAGPVMSVAFSPDGRRLASAGIDKTVKVWEAATGQELLSLKGHADAVVGVAFSPDGRRLVSASRDGTVRVWEATLPTPVVRLERQAARLVESTFGRLVRKADVLDHLRRDATLAEPLRQEALSRAERYLQEPARLDAACRAVVREPRANPAACRRALLQAEEACRLATEKTSYRVALGMAQYRVGEHSQVLETLRPFDPLRPGGGADSPPPESLAFLAMARYQLGQKEQAQATLDRLRETLTELPAGADEARAFLHEAEGLLEGPAVKPQP